MHGISRRTLCVSVVVLLTLLSTADLLEPDKERFEAKFNIHQHFVLAKLNFNFNLCDYRV